MQVYVLVNIFSDGSQQGYPVSTTWVFSTMEAAKEAMQKKIAEIKKDNDMDEDSFDETETTFWGYTNYQHRYGLTDAFKLEIHEDTIDEKLL